MASADDKFKKVGASTLTSLDSPGKSTGDTSINVQSTNNWPTSTGVVFAIRVVDSQGELVEGTYTEWVGTVESSTQISNMSLVFGSDQEYDAGPNTHVYIPVSSDLHNTFIDGILVEHNQDGTHSHLNPDGDVDFSGASSLTSKDGSIPQLQNITYYTSDATWSKPSGLVDNGFVVVEVQGGGGQGGGSQATGSSTASAGAGGGAGGYARSKIEAATLGSSETVTVGAGGSSGGTGADGETGSQSSFGSHVSGNGGSGGQAGSTPGGTMSGRTGAEGGSASGDVAKPGGNGFTSMQQGANNIAWGGSGGDSMYGTGGVGDYDDSAATGNGPGKQYGGGGGGASTANDGGARTGGSGGQGIIIVREFY